MTTSSLQPNRIAPTLRLTITALIFLTLVTGAFAQPRTLKVLHRFKFVIHVGNSANLVTPNSGLVFDQAGNLYGTTFTGGNLVCGQGIGCGGVYKVSPNLDGTWTEADFYDFNDVQGSNLGSNLIPGGAPLFDDKGNLYVTTETDGLTMGGSALLVAPNGINHAYLFPGSKHDGVEPVPGLTRDAAGNLFGVTLLGGTSGGGTVFQLVPDQNDGFTETILQNFGGANRGVTPTSTVILDAAGNLYGVTKSSQDATGAGLVYKLSKTNGLWRKTVVHEFSTALPLQGEFPVGGLIFDGKGNLYGTTSAGGNNACTGGCGTVFQLAVQPNATLKLKTIYSFKGGKDGSSPQVSLVLDPAGNLYGTSSTAIFELRPNANGTWTESLLPHPNAHGGLFSNLILDTAGNLYGTSEASDVGFAGEVFELLVH